MIPIPILKCRSLMARLGGGGSRLGHHDPISLPIVWPASAAELTAIRRDIHGHPEPPSRKCAPRTSSPTSSPNGASRSIAGSPPPAWSARSRARGRARRRSACAPTWTRCTCRKTTTSTTPRRSPARCMPAAMTATRPCCSARPSISPPSRDFDGTVHFIFQPAEEGGGGARVMIEDGLFDKFPCDAVYGMHNMPGVQIGHFAIRPGADDGGHATAGRSPSRAPAATAPCRTAAPIRPSWRPSSSSPCKASSAAT